MAFAYSPVAPNPYALSIAELMQHAGDIRAQEAMAKGQVWGHAVEAIGQDIAKPIAQAADPERQAAQLNLAATKSALATRQGVGQIVATFTKPDGSIDRDGLARTLAQSGIPLEAQDAALKSVESIAAGREAEQTRQQEHFADAGNFVYQALKGLPVDATPQQKSSVVLGGLALAKAGGASDQQLDQFIAAMQQGTDPLHLALGAMSLSPSKRYAEDLKGYNLNRGEVHVDPSGSITNGPPTVGEPKSMLVNGQPTMVTPVTAGDGTVTWKNQQGQPVEVQPLPTAETTPRPETGVVFEKNGKEVTPLWDPQTQQFLDPDTKQPVSVRRPTPASVIIRNENSQAPNLPVWATDASRPSGSDANRIDAVSKMTPNGLYQAALNYLANGQYPPTGRGSDPVAVAQRAAINAKVGAIAADSGMDLPALRAFYKANAGSLTALQKMQDSVQSFMATADKNAGLLEQSLKQLPDTGSPLLNQPLRSFVKNVQGNTAMAPIATYLQSVSNEYARIIAQPNLSGQLTDTARSEAAQLLDPKATIDQMIASVRALNAEGSNRLLSIGDQIKTIQSRMNDAPKGNTSPPGGASTPIPPIKVGGFTVTVH